MKRTHRQALLLSFILASLVLDFTAAYVLRWAIHDLYATHPINETSIAIELIDRIASQSFIFHYAVGIAIGIIFMSILIWGLQFGIKEER